LQWESLTIILYYYNWKVVLLAIPRFENHGKVTMALQLFCKEKDNSSNVAFNNSFIICLSRNISGYVVGTHLVKPPMWHHTWPMFKVISNNVEVVNDQVCPDMTHGYVVDYTLIKSESRILYV
jgi:hypothetical protein